MELVIEIVGQYGVKASDGKWYGIKRPLTKDKFIKGRVYNVETEPWEKNGKNGINIVSVNEEVEAPKKPSKKATADAKEEQSKEFNYCEYNDNKNKRILIQGIYQAVLSSPAVASFVNDSDSLVEVVDSVATVLISKIEAKL